MTRMDARARLKQQAAERAVEFVQDGFIVGLGTGTTAEFATRAIAERVQRGLHLTGVATSRATADLARSLGIPLVDLNDVGEIDVTIDGADEVDPAFNLIKGAGGALTHEKLVAVTTRRQVIVVDEAKLVPRLGVSVALPVEALAFGWRHTLRRLATLGGAGALRGGEHAPFLTDGGNLIIDCRFDGIADPRHLEAAIKLLPGVVESGLFVGLTGVLIVAGPDGVRALDIPPR